MGSDLDLEENGIAAADHTEINVYYITYNFMIFLVFLEGETTVDGRNPAPVDMVKIPLFTGF